MEINVSYTTPDTGIYDNCNCCHGSVTDSNGNTYFSTTEWVVKFNSKGNVVWETQITPLSELPIGSFKRQFLLSQNQSIVFLQSKDDTGDYPWQTFAFSATTGEILWVTGRISSGYSMLASVMGDNNNLIYIGLSKIFAVSSEDGVSILWSYALPRESTWSADDVGQVLISRSNIYIVQERKYLIALQITNVS